MSKDIDPVAEVLKTIRTNGRVSQETVVKAIQHHNAMTSLLLRYQEPLQNTKRSVAPDGGTRAQDKLRQEIEDLRAEVKLKNQEINELKTRLSTIAGRKITDNNPDITDLSDPFRPTKIAEMFRQVYDDEWTHAYEDLEKLNHKETKMIDMLTDIVKMAVPFCKHAEQRQFDGIYICLQDDIVAPKMKSPDGKETFMGTRSKMNSSDEELLRNSLRGLRKSLALLSVPGLVNGFSHVYKKDILKILGTRVVPEGIRSFIDKCIKYVWLMMIQDPPMELLWQKQGDNYDRSRYSFYTQSGPKVVQTVWPAVVLHKGGPLVSKGIVQGSTK